MGKTSLALGFARHVGVEANLPVAVFSLEMSRHEVTQRLMCAEALVDSQSLRTGKMRQEDWGRLVGRLRPAVAGADLHRRHGRHERDGDPLEGAAPEEPGEGPVADRRRLPAADAGRDGVREPRAGDLAHLALAEGAGARPRRAGDGAVAAVARRREPAGQAADAVGPRESGINRAGRGRRHVHLPRRVLRQGLRDEQGHRRADRRQAPLRRHRLRSSSRSARSTPCSPTSPAGRPDVSGTVIVGAQWGDEGKGKIVDLLAERFDDRRPLPGRLERRPHGRRRRRDVQVPAAAVGHPRPGQALRARQRRRDRPGHAVRGARRAREPRPHRRRACASPATRTS